MEAVAGLRERIVNDGYRVDVDERDETLGKRIRDAELEKIPKIVVYGDKESPASLAVRDRGGHQYETSLVELVRELTALADPEKNPATL